LNVELSRSDGLLCGVLGFLLCVFHFFMDWTFLGTGSAQASTTRSNAGLVVTFNVTGRSWLFDAGEGTLQHLQTSSIRIGHIDKVFITHLHGDHVLGLAGLVCAISRAAHSDCWKDRGPLVIYGPTGLRMLLRTTLNIMQAHLHPHRYVVHEMHPHDNSESTDVHEYNVPMHVDEVMGRDMRLKTPPGHPHPYWHVLGHATDVSINEFAPLVDAGSEEGGVLLASPIQHSVYCIGYVWNEHTRPGKLLMDKLQPLLVQHHIPYNDWNGLINQLKHHIPVTLPNTDIILEHSQYVGPPQRGFKFVVLGDTNNPYAVAPYAMHCHVLVHECTNAYLSTDTHTTKDQVDISTRQHGHSTPEMAATFANHVHTKHLFLTHFSARYAGDDSVTSTRVMNEIKALVQSVYKGVVVMARDNLRVTIDKP
jgi:ribonuclease Z